MEDPKDYWNLNFRSFDAVDKEDIQMHIEIQGDPAVLEQINSVIEDEQQKGEENKMINILVNGYSVGDDIINIVWEAGRE